MKRESHKENIIAGEVESKIDKFAGKDFQAFLLWQRNLESVIQKKFPTAEERIKYRLYHVLNGSTVKEGYCPHFDFPGECSVLEAIQKLEV
jgi:hypothetical protein